ncbi:MAG: reverse transcriptase domain-containing protein [Candidatus Thiodiazotropha endolucinida]|nr:endonuclease/exonuclease/phosphatase family protein [Candidatus Thiodiazotropha taylori]MCW4260563.1 reverse transcriptase domain-containing protein [Candidatus Thiodiazotropha endolucinida]
MNISICSYNVRGLGNKIKREQIFAWLKKNKFDICLLQETHSGMETHVLWQQEWGSDAYFSGQSTAREGIGILLKPNISCKILKHTEIVSGRLQALELILNDKELTFINVYGPNDDDSMFFEHLENYLIENDDKTFTIGGDFNTVLDENLDKKNGRINTHRLCRKKIQNIISKFDLIDIWREKHPELKQYTWHSSQKPPVFSRLDYFLISENLRNSTTSIKHCISFKSDHSIVVMGIDFKNYKRGPGYFKLNNSLLLDIDYQNIIKTSINEIVRINEEANPNTLWELVKGTVRNETIKFATKKKKEQNIHEEKLKKDIDTLTKEMAETTNIHKIETIKNNLENKNIELENIIETKLNGLILRSKANLVENDERNSKYFASLEKKRSESKTISMLLINNEMKTEQREILKESETFYKNLYKKRETENTVYNFFDESMNKLEETEKDICDGLLTEEECKSALKDMKNQKSPGSDGLTVEFFKIFWNDIKQYYVNSLNYSYETGSLTDLQKQSIITLIPKPDKDLTTLDSWRPISLLNVDYKIATKALANRVKNVLNKIIDSSQTGFIKGRYIGENIRLLFEIIENVEEQGKPGLIFFSDFEKAFDSLDHTYMINCLNHFNFGQNFINWVKLFYNDAKSCVSNNGYLSDFFPIQRGVRQGCPLSPYLFIICIELLSHIVTSTNDIKGIHITGHEFKKSLFADDASFILDGSIKSFETLINILDNFSYISGLKLNSKKCQVLRIGTNIKNDVVYLKNRKFQWSSTKASSLGMTFTANSENIFKLNLDKKINDFDNCLKQWQHRKLTLMGKITVVKNFALPKLIYVLSSTPNPSKESINRIDKIMYNFIWDGKPEKIKRDILTKDFEKGGLKMIDLQTFIKSLKISWIKRIVASDDNGILNKLYLDKLKPFGGKLLFECNFSDEDIGKILPKNTFLADILAAWFSCNTKTHISDYRNEILWNNQQIKADGNTIMFLNWYYKGIKYIKDIFNDNEKKLLSFTNIKERYNIPENDFLKYLTLIYSIPNRWKTNLQNENIDTPIAPTLISQVMKSNQTNKYIYSFLRNKQMSIERKSELKWNDIFINENLNWKIIYTIAIYATNDIKLRNFQYKYLMRIIPTNTFLLKCNIASSALCDFCLMDIESINHLFWECRHVQHFWMDLSNLLQECNLDLALNLKTITFGITHGLKKLDTQVKNYIILLGKYYIFKNKYQKKYQQLYTLNCFYVKELK